MGRAGRDRDQRGQVRGALAAWAQNNVFTGKVARFNGPGFGFWQQNNVAGNTISCANSVTGAASGYANTSCSS